MKIEACKQENNYSCNNTEQISAEGDVDSVFALVKQELDKLALVEANVVFVLGMWLVLKTLIKSL